MLDLFLVASAPLRTVVLTLQRGARVSVDLDDVVGVCEILDENCTELAFQTRRQPIRVTESYGEIRAYIGLYGREGTLYRTDARP